MPQFDVFVCSRLKVEAQDAGRAERLVSKLLDQDMQQILVQPEVVEIADPQVFAETEGGDDES